MMFTVYIMTNRPYGVLYIGSTDNLNRRALEHREHFRSGFTDKFNCSQLVWYEAHETREAAFKRERQIKRWKRAWKIQSIEELNPNWHDLSQSLL